jgi:hypothetical protein
VCLYASAAALRAAAGAAGAGQLNPVDRQVKSSASGVLGARDDQPRSMMVTSRCAPYW